MNNATQTKATDTKVCSCCGKVRSAEHRATCWALAAKAEVK